MFLKSVCLLTLFELSSVSSVVRGVVFEIYVLCSLKVKENYLLVVV